MEKNRFDIVIFTSTVHWIIGGSVWFDTRLVSTDSGTALFLHVSSEGTMMTNWFAILRKLVRASTVSVSIVLVSWIIVHVVAIVAVAAVALAGVVVVLSILRVAVGTAVAVAVVATVTAIAVVAIVVRTIVAWSDRGHV